MTIGEKIKEIRLQNGLTQEVLAEKTNISTRTIQRIENNEVDPRAYTLEKIANALEVEFKVFSEFQFINIKKEDPTMLAILHLSGMFVMLFPPILIWLWKKEEINGMDTHAKDVINFQLSMWIYLFCSGFLAIVLIGIPILIFLGIFHAVVIIMNTVKVLHGKPYKYPLSQRFLK